MIDHGAGAFGEQSGHPVTDGETTDIRGGFDHDAGRLDAHDGVLVGVQTQGDHDVAEVGRHGANRDSDLAGLAAVRRRPGWARGPGSRMCPCWTCPVATPRHPGAPTAHPPLDCRARDPCTPFPRTRTCGSPTASTAAIVVSFSGASESTSTMRPGCSVWAARTSPHTAAPARSVTSSPGNPTAPRVDTSSIPESFSESQACSAAKASWVRAYVEANGSSSAGCGFEHVVRRRLGVRSGCRG